jgi:ABC-type uncharacterized transport system auxiliary subunit
MNLKIKKSAAAITVSLVFAASLSACSNNQKQSKPKNTNIQVSYTLKEKNHAFAHKNFKLKKNAKVMTGLKKGWAVKSNKGFITEIAGKSQKPKQKIYWTYTINGKWANKGANQQTLKNHDQVQFKLDKVK